MQAIPLRQVGEVFLGVASFRLRVLKHRKPLCMGEELFVAWFQTHCQ